VTVQWQIRPLEQADSREYRARRLEALRAHPEAFGKAFEEELAEAASPPVPDPPGITLGGFIDGRLAGSATMIVSPRIKQRHKGHVVAVYVTPECRRMGLARVLLDALIGHARACGLITLTLAVTAGNDAARRLYLGAGFRPYGVEPSSLRVGDALLDEELMVLALSG
jgi:ribosomal protein S18 acetylase RimI-like enzyme